MESARKNLDKEPVISDNGQGKKRVGLIVPVAKGLMPTREVRQEPPVCTFHLLDGEKLHFYYSKENESLDEETWMRKQAEGGNCFYFEDDELSRDQTTLSPLMSLVGRKKEHEKGMVKIKESINKNNQKEK